MLDLRSGGATNLCLNQFQGRHAMINSDLVNSDVRRFLLAVDQDLAAQARARGCTHCGGVLHSALYPRKVSDTSSNERTECSMRMSFCCNTCRKRTTPASVRYFGRRRYSAVAMVLLSAMQTGIAASALAELRAGLGVARRTLERWRRWWREEFIRTPFWQIERGRFMPPLLQGNLPLAMLERMSGESATTRLIRLLRYLAPMAGPGAITLVDGR